MGELITSNGKQLSEKGREDKMAEWVGCALYKRSRQFKFSKNALKGLKRLKEQQYRRKCNYKKAVYAPQHGGGPDTISAAVLTTALA